MLLFGDNCRLGWCISIEDSLTANPRSFYVRRGDGDLVTELTFVAPEPRLGHCLGAVINMASAVDAMKEQER